MTAVDRTRQQLADALNGDVDAVDRPTLRALRALATCVDEVHEEIGKLDTRLTTIMRAVYAMAASISATVIAAALLLALRQQ